MDRLHSMAAFAKHCRAPDFLEPASGFVQPMRMKILRSIMAVVAAGCALNAAAGPMQRHVVINGHRLTPMQIAQLQYAHCAYSPDGRYWLNMHNGAWGYAGHPWRQGFLGDPCRGGQRQRSLSERGLLYTPGDLSFR